MEKIVTLLKNVARVSGFAALAVLGLAALVSSVDLVLTKVSFGIHTEAIAIVKSLLSTGTQMGIPALLVIIVIAIVIKK